LGLQAQQLGLQLGLKQVRPLGLQLVPLRQGQAQLQVLQQELRPLVLERQLARLQERFQPERKRQRHHR
jgi:hypothetical protein